LILDKREIVTAFTKYILNPLTKPLVGYIPGWALLETVGRNSGKSHFNSVGSALEGNTLWIVAEHGRHADYVKNIEANPRVRVKVGGRWRSGSAQILGDDDPDFHVRRQNFLNAIGLRLVGSDLLPIRVDLA
jgi:deazaflavin-dependent oxidoreductase (nitroreductase family)